jgi:serine/threonine protein kinase/TolB-like protein/cytochrome c-type biogenesis protein CcmH/NrfG
MLETGTKLGHYEIRSQIGEGGMGEVYLAQDTNLGRKVAIKVMPPEVASNHDRMRRFAQEARAAAALNHPNIAHIYEIGETDGTNYIAMEYVEGRTLSKVIHSGGLDLARALKFMQHTAEGLSKAHAAGIVHRDLKPDNIMITHDGHVKILDFGLAKLTLPTGRGDGAASDVATAILEKHSTPGTILGTTGYMSPEQAQGAVDQIDHRSDIFSFGSVLFEVVTGKRAFEGKDTIDTLNKIIREPAPPLSSFISDAPAELQKIVRRCLAKDPEERYQSIKDVAIELRDLRREITDDLDTTVSPMTADSNTQSSNPSTSIGSGATADRTIAQTTSMSSAEYIVTGIKSHKAVILLGLAVIAAVAVGLGFYWHAANTEKAVGSVAVLPFENKNGDVDSEYLSDGLADTLIYRLSQLPNLKVTPRSLVYRYKGKETDPSAIGKELNVDAIMSGRILQRGDQLSISVELVDVRYNKLIWGEQYDRKLSELLATQRDIAKEIVDNLKLTMAGGEAPSAITKQYTQNNEAYQLFLKGRYNWNKRTNEGNDKAVEFLSQAIERDPSFALAYVGLGDAYLLGGGGKGISRSALTEKARAAAQKALDLDPSLGEAHNTLANIKYYQDWDFAGGEAEWKRAIQLSPNYPTAHHWYAEAISSQGRFDESFAEYDRALELDPLSLPIATDRCLSYRYARQYDRAIECLKKLVDVDPNFVRTHYYLGQTYEVNGQFEEALNEFEAGDRLRGKYTDLWTKYKPLTLTVIRTNGEKGYWQECLRQALEVASQKKEPVDDIYLSQLYSELGERDKAFEILNRMRTEHANYLPWIKIEPYYDKIRDDPRFAELVRTVGIP